MDTEKIIINSAYMKERRRGAAFQAAVSDRSSDRLCQWEKLLNVAEDSSIFSKRLRYDGISQEEALDICGDCLAGDRVPQPSWAEILTEVMTSMPVSPEEADQISSLRRENIKLTGPIRSLFPFVAYCESRWKRFAIRNNWGGTAGELPLESLSTMVLNRLYQEAYQVFNTKARFMMMMSYKMKGIWEKVEEELLAGGWQELLEEYPVLARRLGTVIDQYLIFMQEVYQRFCENKETIEREFFQGEKIQRIVSVEGGISDLHQDGRCVLVLALDGNRKLVYKPRALEIDVCWEKFVKEFSEVKALVRVPHAIDLGDFGFVEYISHEPCGSLEEVKTYFYNAGALMALLYAFGGNDFHMENMIASGSRPVIIDTETLMIPVARPFEQGGRDAEIPKARTLGQIIESSVTSLGMLPFIQLDGDKKLKDFSALTGSSEDWDNLPVWNGRKYLADSFPEQVAGGFQHMYQLILKNKQALLEGTFGISMFSGCKFRMLIRTSQVYGNVIKYIHRSVTLKDGFDYSLQTERMVNAFLYTAEENIIPGLLQVFKSEQAALEKGCIPIFYGEPCGEGILDDKGLLFQKYFSKSALKKAEEQILHMNADDLALQLKIIEKSLNFESGDVHVAKVELHKPADNADKEDAKAFVDRQELIQEAEIIYEELMADRIQAPDGDYSWMTSQYNAKTGGSRVGLMSSALYDGLLGIAVFTGALYQITGKSEYKKTSDHCINKTIEDLEFLLPVMERYQFPLGYSSGVGGYIAGLSAVVQYTDNQKAEEIVERILLRINNTMISSDPLLDVLGGTAGLVVALTKNWDGSGEFSKGGLIGNPKYEYPVRQILEWCGRYLLERRTQQTEEGYLIWNSKDSSQPLTGLGHGMSGIALALMKIYRVIGGSEYLEAAQEAVAYETSVFSEHACNWPDFRKPQQTSDPSGVERSALPKQNEPVYRFMSGYCSGAPGVGLSRLSMLSAEAGDHEFLESLRKDISRTGRFIKEYSKEPRDHLCCGRTAGIDFLIEESLASEDKSSLNRAKGMMKMLLDDKKERGRFCILNSDGKYLYNPTLFQGTAGIAYEMLRLTAPEKIRSILI